MRALPVATKPTRIYRNQVPALHFQLFGRGKKASPLVDFPCTLS